MKKIFGWIKTHKLTSILIAIVFYFLLRNSPLAYIGGVSSLGVPSREASYYDSSTANMAPKAGFGGISPYPYEATPQLDVQDRKVVTDTGLSIVVKDVVQTIESIKTKTKELNGYMVSSWVRSPEEGGTGYINVRVPSDKLDAAMEAFRTLAVKIVDENVYGTDITDQYTDYEEQLRILESTKATFQDILSKTIAIEDILTVQERILSVQRQIDSIKGQLKYMDATSSSSLISVNLSTDELSLPYAPSTWRPSVVFKYATRALIKDLRKVANGSIWLGVYSVIWIPVLVVVLVIRKVVRKKRLNQPS